jgi:cytochrome oxidase Cu insertion factor (SCO1/SenC/PrrC family)
MTASASDAPIQRSRKPFWFLVLLFFAPLLLSFALYYGGDGWRPAGSTHHGDLIDPARPLPQVSLPTPAGAELSLESLRGKWNLVYVGDGRCDERCRTALVHIRQSRLALGDDMTRVNRLFLATGECCDQGYLNEEHSGLLVARVDNPAGQRLLAAIPSYAQQPASSAGRIYIVDPLGNLMMSYAPDAPPKGLLEDMEKLLKLSHIG